ncbi:MAG: type II secretion system F family protein [Planctomycetaceae bacterium]|nr:type II secretion system F family protein [Planctomycetaceae bacterium]
MDFQTLLPFIIFGAITMLIWAIMNLFNSSSDERAAERLDELRDPSLRNKGKSSLEEEQTGLKKYFHKAAPALSNSLKPKTELEQNNLKIRLSNAGFHNPSAPTIYLALKAMLAILGLMIGGGFGFFNFGVTQNGWSSLVIGAGLGFYLPEIGVGLLKKSRQEKIFLNLPDALDLLVVCVEAGLGLDAGMRRVSEELEDSAPEVCQELTLCNMQLQMGRKRRDVLHELGVRTGVDDMKALAAILIQADKFGSSIAQALRVQSDSMRLRRSQLAEEKAQQTAVKMIFPLVLFIFPGIFVVLVGPAAIMMMNNLLNS